MFSDRLDFSAEIVEKTIINYLDDFSEAKIVDAMRYSLQGGKKLRAFFVLESSSLFDIDPDLVSSPTFSIINEYLSPKLNSELYHMDFYRIEDESEAEEIDLYDYLDSGKYCFIEWPSQIKNLLPENYVQVEIQVKRDQRRSLRIFRYGRRI